jgi:predicted nuclease of predicted toxin-antitoxin system
MRFLLDQDVYAGTVRFLSGSGHDVVSAAQIGLSQASDWELLRTARDQSRILVTRDRDFGGLIFAGDLRTGVIYLRVSPATLNAVHEELSRVLAEHSEEN